MEKAIVKNGEVEVCSKIEGFKGAWFKAILEDYPTISGRKKLWVRYLTLLREDRSTPLRELAEQDSIRPVPPVDLSYGALLEEGTMVDADHKGGWWPGVVVKILKDENFGVYFDNPPNIMLFNRNQLRYHLEWTRWKWVRPEVKKLDESTGKMAEYRSVIDGVEVAWLPVVLVKEVDDGEKKLIVLHYLPHLNATANATVPSSLVRPTMPRYPVEEYKLWEPVEVFISSGWYQGFVREVHFDKKYLVRLECLECEFVFKHSDLRPVKVWEDGVWHDGPKVSNISSVAKLMCPLIPKRRRSLNPKKHNKAFTKDATGALRKKKVTPPFVSPKEKPTAISPLTPSLAITATPSKQTEAGTEGNKSPGSTQEKKRRVTKGKEKQEEEQGKLHRQRYMK